MRRFKPAFLVKYLASMFNLRTLEVWAAAKRDGEFEGREIGRLVGALNEDLGRLGVAEFTTLSALSEAVADQDGVLSVTEAPQIIQGVNTDLLRMLGFSDGAIQLSRELTEKLIGEANELEYAAASTG